MKEFKEGDVVTVCNRRKEFFRFSIHRRTNPKIKYVVLKVSQSPCPACTGHTQHLLIFMKGWRGWTTSWFSGVWFDLTAKEDMGPCLCDRGDFEEEWDSLEAE